MLDDLEEDLKEINTLKCFMKVREAYNTSKTTI